MPRSNGSKSYSPHRDGAPKLPKRDSNQDKIAWVTKRVTHALAAYANSCGELGSNRHTFLLLRPTSNFPQLRSTTLATLGIRKRDSTPQSLPLFHLERPRGMVTYGTKLG